MTDTQFMKAYTIKEVSKKINVPSGTIRQWEKDLSGLLIIPRTKQGARFYTDMEIELLLKIKQMRDKNLSKEMIRDLLQMHMQSSPGTEMDDFSDPMTLQLDSNFPAVPNQNVQENQYDAFMAAMEEYKFTLISEVKAEIRNGIRKEVLEEVKKRDFKRDIYHC